MATTTELTRTSNESDAQWANRITAASVPGTFVITPTVYCDLPDPLRNNRVKRTAGGGAVFCARCAEWAEIPQHLSVTITDDDTYYCENC